MDTGASAEMPDPKRAIVSADTAFALGSRCCGIEMRKLQFEGHHPFHILLLQFSFLQPVDACLTRLQAGMSLPQRKSSLESRDTPFTSYAPSIHDVEKTQEQDGAPLEISPSHLSQPPHPLIPDGGLTAWLQVLSGISHGLAKDLFDLTFFQASSYSSIAGV